jgi:hypothetical protein
MSSATNTAGGGTASGGVIRKKARTSDVAAESSSKNIDTSRDSERAEDNGLASTSSPQATSTGKEEVLRSRALDDLKNFLERRGMDPSRATEVKIHIRQKGASDSSYSVHYSDKSGSILASKNDVFLYLEKTPKVALNPAAAKRLDAHTRAAKKLGKATRSLPLEIDGITIISFGSLSKNENFHTAVKIFPLGYQVEISYPLARGGAEVVLCEIQSSSALPLFSARLVSSGRKYSGETERDVWDQVWRYLVGVEVFCAYGSAFPLLDICRLSSRW